jgi:hypothetical protein
VTVLPAKSISQGLFAGKKMHTIEYFAVVAVFDIFTAGCAIIFAAGFVTVAEPTFLCPFTPT